MKKTAAVALAALAMTSSPTLAADLFGSAAPPMSYSTSNSQSVEVGSNWYIRGDVGISLDSSPTVSLAGVTTPPQGNASTPWSSSVGPNANSTNFTFDVGFGYRFNNYFRLEAEYDYRGGPGGTNTSTVICPYGLYGVSSQGLATNIEYGYLYNPTNTCNGLLNLTQTNHTGLVGGAVDLGTYWGFTPYVGAGVGVNANVMSGTLNYNQTSNGANYAVDLTPTGTYPQIWVNSAGRAINPQPQIAFAPQNWNRTISSTHYSMAFALSAGVGIQLTPSATLDIGYRYLNSGTSNTLVSPITGTSVKSNNTSQQVRVGIRYMAD